MKALQYNHLVVTTLCLFLAKISTSSETRSTYIVHVDKSHMPEPFTSHHHWHSSLLDSLVDRKSTHSLPSIIYSYDTVFHGFRSELHRLENAPGFVSSFLDTPAELDTTHTPEFLNLSPASGIWPASNFGENIIIGVVDTGVWPESESFKDDGMSSDIPAKWKGKCQEGQEFNSSMCNRKLIGAQYFNKGLLAHEPGLKFSMNSARDVDGHGTHTASTAAGSAVEGANYFEYAKGTATGIAPRARLAVYKVLWREGEGSSSADVLAGIEKAVEDGVDVLSISLSFRRVPLYEDPVAIAAFGAVEKGIVVSVSAGNRGPRYGTLHNGSPWTVTVAAGTDDRLFAGTVTMGNGEIIRGWTLFPAPAVVRNVKLVYNRTLSVCESESMKAVEDEFHLSGNYIMVCDSTLPELQGNFGLGVTTSQINQIQEAQITGAIFISIDPRLRELQRSSFPGVLISPEDGQTLIRYAQRTENPTASIKFQQTFMGTKPSPTVASFSSRGSAPNNPFLMKPDILAPGTWILAAYAPKRVTANIGHKVALSSEFNLISGTSMACPHIAGVAALIKSVHPDWSPAAVKSAMMTTANPLDNTGKPITNNGNDFGDGTRLVSPWDTGSGHVDPNRAVDPGLVYDVAPRDYVDFLCGLNLTREQISTVTRSKAYGCSNPSLDLNYPAFVALCTESNSSRVLNFKRTVTNVGEGPATYGVSVKAPRDSVVRVSPQRLVFGKKNEKRNYTVSVICKKSKDGMSTYGELVWVEQNGMRRVRSPIVVSRSNS